jgi:hypothetical protein
MVWNALASLLEHDVEVEGNLGLVCSIVCDACGS